LQRKSADKGATRLSTYLQDFRHPCAADLKNVLHVSGDSLRGWNFNSVIEIHKDVDQLFILDNREWSVASRNPQRKFKAEFRVGICRTMSECGDRCCGSRDSRRAFIRVANQVAGALIVANSGDGY
jgi:hypothetical protein